MDNFTRHGRIAARHEPIKDLVEIYAVIPHVDRHIIGTHAATADWNELRENTSAPSLLTLSRQQAQKLVDDLHAAGFRPSTAAKLEEPLRILIQQSTHYARRAGFFESALWLISQGYDGVDAKAAARRALVGVGE